MRAPWLILAIALACGPGGPGTSQSGTGDGGTTSTSDPSTTDTDSAEATGPAETGPGTTVADTSTTGAVQCPGVDRPEPWVVELAPGHQECRVDADCGKVYFDCSYCNCAGVNADYEELYPYESLDCREYMGGVCNYDCVLDPELRATCQGGCCSVDQG